MPILKIQERPVNISEVLRAVFGIAHVDGVPIVEQTRDAWVIRPTVGHTWWLYMQPDTKKWVLVLGDIGQRDTFTFGTAWSGSIARWADSLELALQHNGFMPEGWVLEVQATTSAGVK